VYGVNVAPGGVDVPPQGVGEWRRLVLSGPQVATVDACNKYHRMGCKVLGVVTRQVTVEVGGGSSHECARRTLDLFGPSVDALQVWNEPDGGGEASDIASKAIYNDWLAAFRDECARVGWDKPLVAAGLVSGQPDWLRGVDMHGYLLAIHPYDQRPYAGYDDWGWGVLGDLLDAYSAYLPSGTKYWLTECSRTTTDEDVQARYAGALLESVAGRADIDVCMWYCYRSWYLGTELQPFGLVNVDGTYKRTLGAWIEGVEMAEQTSASSNGGDNDALDARIAQLEKQQQLQSEAIAALLSDHYADGPNSAKGKLVQLDPFRYEHLPVQEKQDAR
jgi:hypothetical protein